MKSLPLRIVSSMRALSPENIALLLAIGLVAGIFPIWGFPTILCILASLVARVNFPALQIVNQLSWPLQIAMLVPLARLDLGSLRRRMNSLRQSRAGWGQRLCRPSRAGLAFAFRLDCCCISLC